jgi:CheY-like chemotaxis protein
MHYVDILHIEDDPHCVELMQRALGKMGRQLDFHAVADGELALQFLAARERPPRLIVLDLKIPKVTGLQVLAQLRADEKTRTVPVIVFHLVARAPRRDPLVPGRGQQLRDQTPRI